MRRKAALLPIGSPEISDTIRALLLAPENQKEPLMFPSRLFENWRRTADETRTPGQ